MSRIFAVLLASALVLRVFDRKLVGVRELLNLLSMFGVFAHMENAGFVQRLDLLLE